MQLPVTGSVMDANLLKYDLECADNGDGVFFRIGGGTSQPPDGVLGVIDATTRWALASRRAALSWWSHSVSAYPLFMPNADLNSKAGTMLHEGSHFEGAVLAGSTGHIGPNDTTVDAENVRVAARVSGANLTGKSEPCEYFVNDVLNTFVGLQAFP
ncbi:MAG: hypothetical protein HYV07_20380 [Deltaproteobacteria bacterium]|nr:hypothetical protein [Deltaproteobacteria bacterium]